MVYTSEIEKLERRWAENPKGRNFAPLADAYRKAGELDRALELCKAGLELHPDYVSAHIVYGRCLIDQKNEPGASEVFRKVLALDPENVLALKILAEIAERSGRFSEAVEWLGRLLSADPMNGDAAEALTRAKAKAGAAAGVKAPEPVVRLVPEARAPAVKPKAPAPSAPAPPAPPAPPPPPPPLVIEHASEEVTSTHLDAKGAPPDIETFDGTIDFNAVAREQARADGIEVQEEVELKPQDLVVEGLAHTQYETVFTRPPEPPAVEDELPKIDLPLIMPDDVTAVVPPASPPSAPTPPPPPAAVAMSDDDGAADAAALSRAEPVLTETMAELYLRQGHQEDALRVYRALLAQRPGDARLRGRIEALTGGGRRETVHSFLKRILAGRPGVTPPREATPPPPPSPSLPSGPPAAPPAAGSLGDSQLERAFGTQRAPRDSDPGIVAPGEATRPATDGISLDEVFGEEGAGTRSSLPPASEPAKEPPPAAPPSGGFSFDQFFSTAESTPAGGPASGAGGAGVAVPPPRTSGGTALPPVEDESDLDQFQAWLRGLKS